MAVHAYLVAILLATPVDGAADVLTRMEETILVGADPVLADVNQVAVVLATQETPCVEPRVDALALKSTIVQRLGDAGVRVIERGADSMPRLVVHIEGLDVPGTDQCVVRVQTALDRLVTVPGQGNRQLLTQVWRVGPVMTAVAQSAAGETIGGAALVQATTFADACKAARRLLKNTSAGAALDEVGPAVQGLHPALSYPFVASKSSSVFHRPGCRWAQNISGDNLIGYQTREEAIASGKRPCKSCKP